MSEQQQLTPPKPAKLASVARRSQVVEGQQPDSGDALQEVERVLGRVTAAYGPYEGAWDLAGKTVAYAREKLAPVWNIPPDALAVVGGQPIEGQEQQRILAPNERIEFMKDAGEKGS